MDLCEEVNEFYYRMALYELQMMNGSDYYHGLSYNSLLYLNVISQNEGCTASKIAEILHVTKPAVTLKLNELVKQGAVVKTQSKQDKRVYYVTIHPQLKRVFSIYDELFRKIEQKLKMQYTAEQLDQFAAVLHTISGYEWRKIEDE